MQFVLGLYLLLANNEGKKKSYLPQTPLFMGFFDKSVGKEPACNAEDPSSIPRLGRSPGKGIDYPLQ